MARCETKRTFASRAERIAFYVGADAETVDVYLSTPEGTQQVLDMAIAALESSERAHEEIVVEAEQLGHDVLAAIDAIKEKCGHD